MKNKNKKGFTVIEILLLLIIISLLASILLVNFGTMRLKAQRSAVMTEVGATLRAIESCNLEKRVMFCGGDKHDLTSSGNCSGKYERAGRPVTGTSLCGTNAGPSEWSDSKWPDVERNGYSYSYYAGSDMSQGFYSFSLVRDQDNDDEPDSEASICCTNEGCRQMIDPLYRTEPGRQCYTSTGNSNAFED